MRGNGLRLCWGGLDWVSGRIYPWRRWSGIGTSCSQKWQSPHPWRNSKDVWTWCLGEWFSTTNLQCQVCFRKELVIIVLIKFYLAFSNTLFYFSLSQWKQHRLIYHCLRQHRNRRECFGQQDISGNEYHIFQNNSNFSLITFFSAFRVPLNGFLRKYV